MEKEFVPYQPSLDMKEIGFDEPCFAKYTVIPEDEIDWFMIPEQGITNKTSFGSSKNYNSKSFEEEGTISAPTFSQAFRWFREKYKLFCWIEKFHVDETYIFQIPPANFTKIQGHYKTYEEAELECLIKLIELVKNK